MFPILPVPDRLLLLNISNDVLLPGGVMKIPISASENAYISNYLMKLEEKSSSPIIGIVPNKEKNCSTSSHNPIGTAAYLLQFTNANWPKQLYMMTVVGICRFRVNKILSKDTLSLASVTPIVDSLDQKNEEQVALLKEFKECTLRLMDVLNMFHPLINRMKKTMGNIPDTAIVDACASMVSSAYHDKLDILNTVDLSERMKKILPILHKHIEGLELVQDSLKKGEIPKRGLPVIKLLRTRIPHTDSVMDLDEGDDLTELQEKLKKANLPDYAQKVAFKEFQRLKRMGTFNPEHGVIRNYVELMSELPWSVSSKETIDLKKAKKDLDADHYGMNKLKRRVLEYLAVRQLKNNLRGPILCFVGPPGVGKTSIGRSIALTLGREFNRISLGGVCNQSDIRGHRRTYVGALPGRIIQAIKSVGVNNPVILLDEIDKMGTGINGDPGAALLEVLDPEQNCHFVDHYLNVPFDLSQVTFIATANRVNNISPALLDRMEIIHVSGYTQEEKFHIAERHLLPKQLLQHGLSKKLMLLPPESLKLLISRYTREAGVRTLERKLAALCRAVAVNVAEKRYDPDDKKISLPVEIDSALLDDILGPPLYDGNEIWWRVGVAGVAVGLAWTSADGEVTIVEASKMTGGCGELVLTGHLGNVMKESAKLALNWVRTAAVKYGLLNENGDLMNDTDVHVHFPAGAVVKDGPSAGVTIATALISLFAEIPVSPDVALTGEITLSGLVLPVGGIKDKVLAAHRSGLKRVILPKKCEKDLAEIPQNILSEMTMVFVNHMHEVIEAAFNGELSPVRHTKNIKSKL